MTDRENLEWLVYWCLIEENPPISMGRGKELLGFQYMEDMRDWFTNYKKYRDIITGLKEAVDYEKNNKK